MRFLRALLGIFFPSKKSEPEPVVTEPDPTTHF
jgi:hypothetical protein